MSRIQKGRSAPLNVTKEARHRIYAGLGWDPKEKAGLLDKAREIAGGPKTWHDLDLSCYIYGPDRNYIDTVSADLEQAADASGKIYHSGDNVEGVGDGDDEQISAELIEMPRTIDHMVFVATIKSGHSFGQIIAPEIRLVDGYSDFEFLKTPLNLEEGKDKSAFIFARVYRDGDKWALHNISEFMDAQDKEDWPETIKGYL